MGGKFMTARQCLRAVFVATGTMFLAGPSEAASLVHVPGSTIKLEQLIGDFDKQRKVNTANRTFERYRIQGTDLGNSFEHEGQPTFFSATLSAALAAMSLPPAAPPIPKRGSVSIFLPTPRATTSRSNPPASQ
jgi:hypothetical protein